MKCRPAFQSRGWLTWLLRTERRVNRVRLRPAVVATWLANPGWGPITAVGFEHGRTNPKASTLYKWKRALEAAGLRFINSHDVNGTGVSRT